jgi:hypothetical protein
MSWRSRSERTNSKLRVGHIIHMEIGQPDFGAPQPVIETAVAAMRQLPLAYTSALGIPALQKNDRHAPCGTIRRQGRSNVSRCHSWRIGRLPVAAGDAD